MAKWRINHGGWQAMAAIGIAVVVSGLAGCAHQGASDANGAVAESASGGGEADVRRRARIRLELAANYLQMGQTTVAMEEVRQAITTDPTYADAYHLRGLIYMNMGDLALAEDSLKRAQRRLQTERNPEERKALKAKIDALRRGRVGPAAV